jgi:hypothetical protein
MRRDRFGDNHWRTGEAQLALGLALSAAGQRERAETMLREASARIQLQRQAQPRLAALAIDALAQAQR